MAKQPLRLNNLSGVVTNDGDLSEFCKPEKRDFSTAFGNLFSQERVIKRKEELFFSGP